MADFNGICAYLHSFTLHEVRFIGQNLRNILWKPSGIQDYNRPADLRRGSRVMSMNAYRVLQLIGIFVLISEAILIHLRLVPEIHESIALPALSRIMTQITLFWMLLYYIQLLPAVGHLVIGVFRGLYIFVYFLIIFAMFFVSCAEGLRSVAIYYCIEQIGYFLSSYYSTFLMMLNMFDMSPAATSFPALIMQVYITLFLGILLMNFLIGLLSEEGAKVERHKDILQLLAKIHISVDYDSMLSSGVHAEDCGNAGTLCDRV
jgi:hypothetical protein